MANDYPNFVFGDEVTLHEKLVMTSYVNIRTKATIKKTARKHLKMPFKQWKETVNHAKFITNQP